jgi:hypothetical protein
MRGNSEFSSVESPGPGPRQAVPVLPAERAIEAALFCPDARDSTGNLNFGAPVEGRTRLMKELFLVAMETDAGKSGLLGFPFTPGPYGPSSFDVQRGLEHLTRTAFVRQESLGVQEGVRLSLLPQGWQSARSLWTALPPAAAQAFFSIKSRFNSTPLTALLFYVYSTYPQYTVNSRIREDILGLSV